MTTFISKKQVIGDGMEDQIVCEAEAVTKRCKIGELIRQQGRPRKTER